MPETINDIEKLSSCRSLLGKAQELCYVLRSLEKEGLLGLFKTGTQQIYRFSSSSPLPWTCPFFALIKQIALTFSVCLSIIRENWCPM